MNVDVSERCFTTEDSSYVGLPIVTKAANRGEPRQLLCSEMIHWDDYRASRGLSDGHPRMQDVFASAYEEPVPRPFVFGGDTFVSRVISVVASQVGSSSQVFCTEMQHWDDVAAGRGIQSGAPTMARLFRPFDSRLFLVFDLNERKVIEFAGNSVALISYGGDRQTYCSEMEHWDDFVLAKTGQLPQPSMESLFSNP